MSLDITTVSRPLEYITKKSDFHEGNFHQVLVALDSGSDVLVHLDQDVIDVWDNLLSITVDLISYIGYRERNNPSNVVNKKWWRFEILDYRTFNRVRNDMAFETQLELIPLKSKLEYTDGPKLEELKIKISKLKDTEYRILNDSESIIRTYFEYYNALELTVKNLKYHYHKIGKASTKLIQKGAGTDRLK